MAIVFAGGTILYKTQFQKATALSSTEAEFYALCDAGKMTLYVRSVLDELGIDQEEATHVFEDNQACLQLVNASQPTRRTKHIEVRQFAILDWVKGDLLNVLRVNTNDNAADTFTKANAKILFHRHFDVLMGKQPPIYVGPNAGTSRTKRVHDNTVELQSPTVLTTSATSPILVNHINIYDVFNQSSWGGCCTDVST